MTLNRHDCNGHTGLHSNKKIADHRCKICFKLLINWKGVKMDKFVPICNSQNSRPDADANKILVKEKSSKSVFSLIKRYLSDSTDYLSGSHHQNDETKCEANFKVCKSCFSLINKLEDHWKQFNEIRDQLRIKYIKSNRLFTASNRKLFKKTTKCGKKKPKTVKKTKTNPNKINLTHKTTPNQAIPFNLSNTNDSAPKQKHTQNPSNVIHFFFNNFIFLFYF